MEQNVFVAYDFLIGASLTDNLHAVASKPPEGYVVKWPGDPKGRSQGAIWKDVVQPGIDACDRFLAFIDLPNANVGFEIGYALGVGKQAAWAQIRPKPHAWVEGPPLHGFLRERLQTPDAIRKAIKNEKWVSLEGEREVGTGVLLLCPMITGAAYLEQMPEEWDWKALPDDGWDIHDLHKLTAGVGLVVWVIAPHADGEGERDGIENAALSVLAGYAESQPDLELRILEHTSARTVVDVIKSRKSFSNPPQFRKVIDAIEEVWKEKLAPSADKSSLVDGGEPPLIPERPNNIEPHPEDGWVTISDRFIGRDVHLADAEAAVEGLFTRFRDGVEASGPGAVKLIWVHGFGGMGKSWFLHRARMRGENEEPKLVSLIIDWDKETWRQPLTGEPRIPAQMFETIAYRLAQRIGVEAADPYWLAVAETKQLAPDHQRWRQNFEAQLSNAASEDPSQTDSGLQQLLAAEGLWHDDDGKRRELLQHLRRDPIRFRELFEAWATAGGESRLAVMNPDKLRANGLRQALREVMQSQPLLLMIDTAEVLNSDLDHWLRGLLNPLFREPLPILAFIGNRLRPDNAQPDGAKHGWRSDLPKAALRIVPFDESVRFTVEDIESALGNLTRSVEVPISELARQLHRATRGVPLGLRSVLDLHEDSDPILDSLQGDEDELPLDEREAVRRIIGIVCDRLLIHLINRPEREEDLRDIIALALLPEANREILNSIWGESPRRRLLDLSDRYSLVASGDLHPTVRGYLRQHWRAEDNRPQLLDDVLDQLQCAVEGLPEATVEDGGAETQARRVLELNLRSWRDSDRVVDDLAPLLASSLAHVTNPQPVADLIAELPLLGRDLEGARKLWKDRRLGEGQLPKRGAILHWLHGLKPSQNWSEHDDACLKLLLGIENSGESLDAPQALRCLDHLKSAAEFFGVEDVPQKGAVGQAAYDLTFALGPVQSGDTYHPAERLEAFELAQACGIETKILRNNLGNLYKNHLERYEDAEASYREAIALDPKYALPHHGLGNLYQYQLERYEDAEASYREAIALDPKDALPHNGLGTLYQNHLGRYEDAEASYREAIALDPKYAQPHNGLGTLYQNHFGRYEEAEASYREAIALDPKYANAQGALAELYAFRLNRVAEAIEALEEMRHWDEPDPFQTATLGWIEWLLRDDQTRAGELAEESCRIDPMNHHVQLLQIGLQIEASGFEEQTPQLLAWFRECEALYPPLNLHFLIGLIRKIEAKGELPRFEELLGEAAERDIWRPWSQAITAMLEGADPDTLDDPMARKIAVEYLETRY